MAVAVEQIRLYTEDEYLEREENALEKSEFYRDRIYAMARASPEHDLISINTASELKFALKGRQCVTHGSDMRIRVSPAGLFTYADVVVSCGKPQYDRVNPANLLNPTLIVELLSASTEGYDRGDKFALYETLDSFTDYLLVAQDKPRVEHRRKTPEGNWILSVVHGLKAFVEIDSIGIALPLAGIYDQVEFQEPQLRIDSQPCD